MGIPPCQHIIQQRVKLAKTLLANPALSITEVAHYCGFSSQSHLIKHFKQQMELTPKRDRDRDRG
ncbi:MAG: helix-turn-helix transcriptional regulator [Elainellaceae cyanobacterium]